MRTPDGYKLAQMILGRDASFAGPSGRQMLNVRGMPFPAVWPVSQKRMRTQRRDVKSARRLNLPRTMIFDGQGLERLR